MEKYILELISENNRVIIPNFGAFIVSKEHGASILFNNFLSFNDGLLVNYVAEKKGVDTIIATEEVFEYVDKLKRELDESGSYRIDKLGTFKKDDNGILRFQQAEDFADQFNEEATTNTDLEDTIKTEAEEPTKVALQDLEADSTPDKAEKTKEEKESTALVEPQKEAVKEETKNTVTPPIIVPPVEKKVVEDKRPEETKKVEVKKEKYVEKKKDNRGLIIYIAIAAILVIALLVYFLFLRKPKKQLPTVPKKELIKKPVKKPVLKDTVKIKPKVVETPKTKKPANDILKGQIHIIVGGFKEVGNANKMVDKLKSKGYSKAQTIKKGNMHLVSIDYDTSYGKVEARQQEVLADQMGSWLYTIK